MTPPPALSGLVVLEVADTPGAAFAASLLADFGATVIACEPPGTGSALRAGGPAGLDGVRWAVLARGKLSVATGSAAQRAALLARADLLVTDVPASQRGENAWLAAWEASAPDARPLLLELVAPGADRPDRWRWGLRPEFAAAASGMMALTGQEDGPPVQPEAPVAEYLAGALGAAQALMALRAGVADTTLTVPLHRAVQRMIEWQAPMATAFGQAETRRGNSFPMNAGIANMHATGDGKYVAVSAVTQATAERLLEMIGGPALRGDPRFATAAARSAGLGELYALIDAWMAARPLAEIQSTAAAHDVVLGPVYDTGDILADEQVAAREGVREVALPGGAGLAMPGVIPRIEGAAAAPLRPAPALGGETVPALPPRSPRPPRGGRPLRVLELGTVIAGPFAGSLLADLGAEVIKIEPPGQGDSLRQMGRAKGGQPLWFGTSARDKRCLTLNLKAPEGKALFRRLAADADVLVENYRPGVLDRLGLGWPALQALNPGLVMLSISGFGQTGPQSARPGFGKIAEGISGVVSLTGVAGETPLFVGFSLADACTGLFGLYGVAVALYRRDVLGPQGAKGGGTRIDLALYEPLLRMLDCQIAVHRARGAPACRAGSNDPHGFGRPGPDRPQFRSLRTGSGDWLFLAIPPAEDAAEVAAWCAARDTEAVRQGLSIRGIAAVPVFDGASIAAEPYFQARGDVRALDLPGVGPLSVPGPIGGGPTRGFRAPAIGADTDAILAELGVDAAEIARLRSLGVV